MHTGSRTRPAALPSGVVPVFLVAASFWARAKPRALRTAVIALVHPLLLLLVFGFAIDVIIGSGRTTADLLGTESYFRYVAPGLITSSAVQGAMAETSYPVLDAVRYDRIYQRFLASPLTPSHIVLGHLVWVVGRVALPTSVLAVLIVLTGGAGIGFVASLAVAVATAAGCGALMMSFAVGARSENSFNPVMRFVVLPAVLFSGTFYPISTLPGVIRPLAWLSPLWHGTELARSLSLGSFTATSLINAGYVVMLVVVGLCLARRSFHRRLYR